MDGIRRTPSERPPQAERAPLRPEQAPGSLKTPPKIEPFRDSGPHSAKILTPHPGNIPSERPSLLGRIKSWFGGAEAPLKPQLAARDVAPSNAKENIENDWVNIAPERNYRVPENVDMKQVEADLENILDEENTRAQLEALPSPPKTIPEAEDDLSARLNRLREGYVPVSTEAQLSARLRDLTGTKIPTLENAMAGLSTLRVNPQRSSVEEIKSQQNQFSQSVSGMIIELKTYLGRAVEPKDKLAANKYASMLNERIRLESKSIGNTIIQISQRKDLPPSTKQSIITELRDKMTTLKKAASQIQQFRFAVAKQVGDVVNQQKKG